VGAPGTPTATPSSGGKLIVVATTAQIGYLAARVGGDRINLTTLMGPGVDPHTYRAKPSDLIAIENSDVVLLNGIGLENPLAQTLNAAPQNRKVVVTNTITLRRTTVFGLTMDDPHVWHSMPNLKLMLTEVAFALMDRDPANAEYFRVNAINYRTEIDQADAQIRGIINTIPQANRRLVTTHDALGYFAGEYGLEQFGTIIPSVDSNAEPSAGQLANLVQRMRDNNIKCVFAETTLNPALAQTIANETGATLVTGLYADSVGPPGSQGGTPHGADIVNANLMASCMR
jgi:ABC-type Zn uptake system ZnuABC Zn-binding protein ZnuA